MGQLLSPGIGITEKNLGFSTPNLPSANTFSVLRSDYGEAYALRQVSNENLLVANFGKPTSKNYNDWFNTRNFYDYASSMYVIRPIDQAKATENTSMVLSGGFAGRAIAMSTAGTTGTFEVGDALTQVGTSATASVSAIKVPTVPADTTYLFLNLENGTDFDLTGLVTGGTSGATGVPTGANASVQIAEDSVYQCSKQANLYNQDIAEVTIPSLVTDSVSVVLAEFTEVGGDGTGVYTYQDAAVFGTLQLENDGVAANGDLEDNVATPHIDLAYTTQYDAIWNATTYSGGNPVGWSSTVSIVDDTAGDTGRQLMTGTVTSAKLTFYNRYITSEQDVAVAVCSDSEAWDENISTDVTTKFSSFFEFKPDFANQEFAVVIFLRNSDGTFTKVEDWVVSYSPTGKNAFNKSIYAEDVFLNSQSRVFCKVGATGANVNTAAGALPVLRHVHYNTIYPRSADTFPTITYTGSYSQGDVDEAFDLVNDATTSDLGLMLGHELSPAKAPATAMMRKETFGITAPFAYSQLVGKTSDEATSYLVKNMGLVGYLGGGAYDDLGPSGKNDYSAIFGNMKYQYDKYNDMNRWLPVHGDIAGLMAETDREFFPWYAASGLQRGVIKNVIKLAFNPNKTSRDNLYLNSINQLYIVPGQGTAVVWGQKTATAVASIFSRINIRRLMITIEKTLSRALLPFVMEFADETTWNLIAGVINPYLSTIQSQRGLEEFKVIVDSTNNTSEVINNNQIVVDIFVKPTQVAEFIQLNFNVTKSGVSFDELI